MSDVDRPGVSVFAMPGAELGKHIFQKILEK